jgi:hypothetical protein
MGESAGVGRLNRVLVAIKPGVVQIPWESRDRLLDELRRHDSGRTVVAAFEAVGATRPVELDDGGKVLVVDTIRHMEVKPSSPTAWRISATH